MFQKADWNRTNVIDYGIKVNHATVVQMQLQLMVKDDGWPSRKFSGSCSLSCFCFDLSLLHLATATSIGEKPKNEYGRMNTEDIATETKENILHGKI